MRRTTPAALALALAAALAGHARGQLPRYIGPGSTVQGDILRGEGVFLEGAGLYNYYSAVAGSIETDTWMRLNEYIYQSIQHENAEKARRTAERRSRHLKNYNAILDRLRNNPNYNDVAKGEALNELLKDLEGPRLTSSYRGNAFPIEGDILKRIPFVYGPANETIAMARIIPTRKWPIALRGPEFERERDAYKRALDHVLLLQIQGKTTRESLAELGGAVETLLQKLPQVIPAEKETLFLEAKNYLTELKRSQEMMKKKDIELIIGEIDRNHVTTVQQLVEFMRKYNLQFGVSRIGEERETYPKLYAALKAQVDELETATKDQGREPQGGDTRDSNR